MHILQPLLLDWLGMGSFCLKFVNFSRNTYKIWQGLLGLMFEEVWEITVRNLSAYQIAEPNRRCHHCNKHWFATTPCWWGCWISNIKEIHALVSEIQAQRHMDEWRDERHFIIPCALVWLRDKKWEVRGCGTGHPPWNFDFLHFK